MKHIKLLEKLKVKPEFYITDKVVGGKNLLSALSNISDESFVISEKIPFQAVLAYTKKDFFSLGRYHLVDNQTNGKTLNNIIDFIKNRKEIAEIVGIGAGRALNYAKFISMKTGKPIITAPTALTTHVYASPKLHADKAIRDLGIKRRIDWKIPDLVLIDVLFLEKMQKEDKKLINTGLGDLMAFISAVEDWKMAYEKGTTDINYAVVDLTERIIKDMGKLDVNLPLSKWIKDYVLMQTALCYITDLVGPAPAAGSEHLFSNAAERMFENSEKQPLHGELVALGTLIMSYLQGKNYKNVQRLMKKFKLPTSLKNMGLTKEQAIECLYNSKKEGKKKGRYTILDKLNMNEKHCRKTIYELLSRKIIKE